VNTPTLVVVNRTPALVQSSIIGQQGVVPAMRPDRAGMYRVLFGTRECYLYRREFTVADLQAAEQEVRL